MDKKTIKLSLTNEEWDILLKGLDYSSYEAPYDNWERKRNTLLKRLSKKIETKLDKKY